MTRLASLVAQRLGIAGPIQAGLLFRTTYGIATALTCIAVVMVLTAAEQGYFFTFLSILAAQQLLELGLSLVLMQVASHESVGLEWRGRSAGFLRPGSAERLAALLSGSLRWYGWMAAVFLVTVIPAGWILLSGDAQSGVGSAWQSPWLFAGAMFALNFTLVPVLSLLEGCGRISEVFVFRSGQELAASLGLWIGLLAGLGLYSLGIYLAIRAAGGAVYLWLYRGFFAQLLAQRAPQGGSFKWAAEIWPLQWKISLSWGTGFLIFQLTTPIVFAVLGPVAAGQWSLTYLVLYTVGQFWLVWVSARAPELGNLAAQRKYREMEAMFFQGAKWSIAACAVGLSLTWLALRLAFDHQLPYVDRFIGPAAAAMLTAWALVNHAVNVMAVYLRAHREEPFLLPSLAGGVLIPASVVFFGSRFGMAGIAASYLAIGCVIGLGWGGVLFWRKILACRIAAS